MGSKALVRKSDTISKNGHGRAIALSREFVFSSGVVGKIVPVSPWLLNDAFDFVERPEVPMVEMPGVNGPVPEENPADPAYLKAMEKYIAEINKLSREFYVEYGIELEVDENAIADKEAMLGEMAARYGKEGPKAPDDPRGRKIWYFERCVIASPQEYERFMDAVRGVTEPQGENIANAARSFPGDDQGARG